MEPARALQQEAAWFARSMETSGEPHLIAESRMRSMTYKPHLTLTQYQCPRCWVKTSTRNGLTPIDGTDEYDMLRCHGCGADFIIPF